MRTMPALPGRLRAMLPGAKPLGVDREAKVIRGYVVAQLGAFKTAGRGQFDDASLRQIVDLMGKHPKGLRSRFAHPTESNDGLGSYLGRAKNPRMDGDRVRADLHLDPTSFSSPNGNLGGYLLDLAESDSDALSSSLVLQADKEAVLDAKGKPALDQDGQPVPPVIPEGGDQGPDEITAPYLSPQRGDRPNEPPTIVMHSRLADVRERALTDPMEPDM